MSEDPTSNNDNNIEQPPQDFTYFREMEDNMKLFEMKLKRLEKNAFGAGASSKEVNKDLNISIDIINHQAKPSSKPIINNNTNDIDFDNLVIELNQKNRIIAELNEELEFSRKNEDLIDELHREIRIKDNECTKQYEENERLKNLIENFKKENINLKTSLTRVEKENTSLTAKVHELIEDNQLLDRKVSSNDTILKSLKVDYDSILKNFAILKKQYDDKMEELKKSSTNNGTNNHNRKSNHTYGTSYNENNNALYNSYKLNPDTAGVTSDHKVLNGKKTEYTYKSKHIPNDIEKYPSEYKQLPHKTEIDYIEGKISSLTKEKAQIENGLFKLPVNPKTLTEINKKRNMENILQEIEDKITELKLRLRQLTKK
jgi:hypothetical protein